LDRDKIMSGYGIFHTLKYFSTYYMLGCCSLIATKFSLSLAAPLQHWAPRGAIREGAYLIATCIKRDNKKQPLQD
jgi:hypothetical protein